MTQRLQQLWQRMAVALAALVAFARAFLARAHAWPLRPRAAFAAMRQHLARVRHHLARVRAQLARLRELLARLHQQIARELQQPTPLPQRLSDMKAVAERALSSLVRRLSPVSHRLSPLLRRVSPLFRWLAPLSRALAQLWRRLTPVRRRLALLWHHTLAAARRMFESTRSLLQRPRIAAVFHHVLVPVFGLALLVISMGGTWHLASAQPKTIAEELQAKEGVPAEPPPPPKKPASQLTGKVNLNTANEQQLMLLPTVGPAKAERIITWRKKNGGFRRIADIRRVKGFGYKTFKRLEPFLDIKGETTLK